MESVSKRAQEAIANFFSRVAKEQKGWWYVVQLDETHPSSLASLFGVTEERLTEILKLCGLAKSHGSRVRIQGDAFSNLLKSSMDIEGAAFEICKLQGYEQRKWCLKIGRSDKNNKTSSGTNANAKMQFSNSTWKAPLPKRKHQRQLQDDFDDIFDDDDAIHQRGENSRFRTPTS